MDDFRDKVAVVTGGASGIGRALAERCVQEGMRVVLADIDEDALDHTEQELTAAGATVLAVRTDVAQFNDVQALAAKTLDAFGAVHLLFNNAGVCTPTAPAWEYSLKDWEWVLGVNLWGVIHGIRVFVPIMLSQDAECHIVNTASGAGLTPVPSWAPYASSKHAVVGLSETLYLQLAEGPWHVSASVLCPGFVKTRFGDSHRNRPCELRNPNEGEVSMSPAILEALADGMPPERLADLTFDAIRERRFYILTHLNVMQDVDMHFQNLLHDRNPI